MKKCPYCGFPDNYEDAIYCTKCGSSLTGSRKELISERLTLLGGELRLLTAIFVNFVGFEKLTAITDYNQAMLFLRETLNEIEDVIHSFDGTSNKILPDIRVLGIFGAPRAHPDDIIRAMRCAFEIRLRWQKQRAAIKELGPIDMTIGINTGRAFFGYLLSEFLTVIGDTINTTARLTEICPPGEILVNDTTVKKAIEYVVVEDYGERVVKGKRERIKAHLLKGLKEDTIFLKVLQLPIFGRVEELNKLMTLTAGLKENRMILGIINGQMGIGKTRLKDEFEKQLAKNNSYNFYEAQCAADVQSPYYPFKFLLKAYFGITDAESREIAKGKIERVCSQLNLSHDDIKGLSSLMFTDMPRVTTDELRNVNEEIHMAIKNFIQRECQKRSVVFIFEEFNRADAMSKDLICYLGQELKNTPAMFLLVNPAREFVSKIPIATEEINISPLSYDEVHGLIKFLLGDVDDKLVDFIYRAAGGNPMFTIEAIRNTRRTNLIKEISGRWYLEKEQRLAFLDDLYGVVMSTIDSLPPNDRLVVDYASVVGYSFNKRILEEMLDNRDISDRLEYLVGEGYFVLSKGEIDPVLVFRHNLLKDAAYSVIPVRKRKEIHQKVAVMMEEVYNNQLSDFYEDIGHHYLASENWRKAAVYNKLSGDKAKNLFAIDQAFSFYNATLKIKEDWDSYVSDELVREVLLNITDLHEISGNVPRMVSIAEEGLTSARRDKVLKDELLFIERLGYAKIMGNSFSEAEELLLMGIQKCDEKTQDINTILNAHLGFAYAGKYEYEKSLLYYNLSWNIARNNNIRNGEVFCLYNLAHLHRSLGNYEQALDYLNYGLENFSKVDEIRRIMQFRHLVGEICYLIGDYEKAKEMLTDVFYSAEVIGKIDILVKAGVALALINAVHNKNEAEVNKYLALADEKIGFFTQENLLAEINYKKALIFYELGDSIKAGDFLTNALRVAQNYNQKEIECECLLLLTQVENAQQEENVRKAMTIAETMKLSPQIARVMYRMAEISRLNEDADKSRYYGSKALVMYNDIKSKLQPENQQHYARKREYIRLLEL